jgi:uncharacterized protein YkwD
VGFVVVAAVLAAAALGLGAAPVGAAATSSSMAAQVLDLLNHDREARGLVKLRAWDPLESIARDRSANMASRNSLSHDAAGGDLGADYDHAGIQWYGFGEIIGVSSAGWGNASAKHIYSMWKASPPHAAIMFSRTFNYLGIGFAYRSSNGTTWSSAVFSESRDHTAPKAEKNGKRVDGRDVTFRWTGHDRKLQTHMSGLDDFDVQYRVDGGGWHNLKTNTRKTSATLHDRARGHWYGFRVRASDQRGNLSGWTNEGRVRVP